MFFKSENTSNKPKPARLDKVQHKEDPLTHFLRVEDLLVKISVILFIILIFLIFFLICFLAVPPTGGFYWW